MGAVSGRQQKKRNGFAKGPKETILPFSALEVSAIRTEAPRIATKY
jgi:hypothetical protein